MLDRVMIASIFRPAAAIFLLGLLFVGCSDPAADDGAAGDTPADTVAESDDVAAIVGLSHGDTVATLTGLLPADTRGVLAVDLARLFSDGSPDDVVELLDGRGAAPAFNELLAAIGSLASSVDIPGEMTSALVGQTTDTADGTFLLARLRKEALDEVVAGPMPTLAGTYGPASRELYVDQNENHLTLLPGGVLVVGTRFVVESVLDVAEGNGPRDTTAIAPFLGALSTEPHISFVYGLPALFDNVEPDRTLRAAALVSGGFDVVDGQIGGEMVFHTSNAAEFVETYNVLNRHAAQGENPSERPLALADPLVDGLGRVVVTIPATPLGGSPEEAVESRNIFKKLFVGMQAHEYAEGVAGGNNAVWLDLIVKSEEDGDTPLSPGSVFIRREFRDRAAIETFEANELPAGFTLAPTRFFESDGPDGGYFLALNLYNAGGGSIVSGARAEWDVFVNPPLGADPDAGVRPRFMIVDALAEEVSADSVNLLTPAEPVSHDLVDGAVVSSIRRFEGDREAPAFESTFPRPDPAEADVARFTREMAIGNDYIYWGHGVSDRVLYNATTFNHDAYFVDPAQVTITDDSRWAQYLKPDVQDVVYYVNTLEYVASPMANLDSDYLDITPEWLAELVGFTTNGHQEGLMRRAVEQLFRGQADSLVGFRVDNETPSAFYNFEITDPDALSAALDLPPGHSLAPTTLFDGASGGYYLTLSMYEIDDAVEGTRAEWSVYTDDGSGRPNLMVLDVMTAETSVDPVDIIGLPNEVRHDLADGVLSTRLSSPTISFEASFATAGATDEELALDWIEAGDEVCHLNGVCDAFYYDAETLDVPVHRPAEVTVNAFSTPWNEFLGEAPTAVFYRDNAQQYVVKRWHNLEVAVQELPFSGLDGRTHVISGSGSLVGRGTDLVNSDYTYTGDVVLQGDMLTFSIDQQVDNALGVAHIFTTGSFDLMSGSGTQTVVDCVGPALLCSDIAIGSTAFYAPEALDASDPDAISWQVNAAVDLGGSFGTADSASTFIATREG